MKSAFSFIILKRVNKYGIFCNNKINDKLFENNFLNFPKQHCLYEGVNFFPMNT